MAVVTVVAVGGVVVVVVVVVVVLAVVVTVVVVVWSFDHVVRFASYNRPIVNVILATSIDKRDLLHANLFTTKSSPKIIFYAAATTIKPTVLVTVSIYRGINFVDRTIFRRCKF